MNRRGFIGLLAGLSGLLAMGRPKPAESKQERVLPLPEGQKLYAVSDWAVDTDIASTVVYWRGQDGIFHILDMYECTAEQGEDQTCRCRRYFDTPGHPPHGVGQRFLLPLEQIEERWVSLE